MILDQLDQADRYSGLNPLFHRAFEFLRSTRLADLPSGKLEIDGDRIFAMIAKGPGHSREQAKLEVHRAYVDIQVAVAGVDEIGWKSLPLCAAPEGEYDAETDVQLFADAPDAWMAVGSGAFAVFYPEDAHAPMVSDGELHKVVVKVLVDI